MITNINAAVLYVRDQDRSLEFFRDKLGFSVRNDGEMWPGARWIDVVPPGAQTAVALLQGTDFERDPSEGPAAITFSCDDVQATYSELRAKGVEVSEPVTEPWNTYIQVTDPDGHVFIVGQR